MSSNPENLNELSSRQEADEAALPRAGADLEDSTSHTEAAQASLRNMALGEKEKHEREINTASQLLDQVRGYFGLTG